MNKGSKVTITTFAGRRDRMELLNNYIRAGIEAGLFDEWHIWDFARTTEDREWLSTLTDTVAQTPSAGEMYYDSKIKAAVRDQKAVVEFSVSTANDAIIGFKRTSPTSGPSFEIVVGGWGNRRCALRIFSDNESLENVRSRVGAQNTLEIETPQILQYDTDNRIRIELTKFNITLIVNRKTTFSHDIEIGQVQYSILHRSGYGANAFWDFFDWQDRTIKLFLSGPLNGKGQFYSPYYQHYINHARIYSNDILIKCDDDIVFMDLGKLADFIDFRRKNSQYYLISANVINNGVCAYFQQKEGNIPLELMQLEMPDMGFGGSLWKSADLALSLHNHFLDQPQKFLSNKEEVIEWQQRVSINFIAFLGSDLNHMWDFNDDEGDLCFKSRLRSGKPNCIYTPLIVAHLTFGPQDQGFPISDVVNRYRILWEEK